MAVLLLPVVLNISAPLPVAVLPRPVVLLRSALSPVAVLLRPVVLLKSALAPEETRRFTADSPLNAIRQDQHQEKGALVAAAGDAGAEAGDFGIEQVLAV